MSIKRLIPWTQKPPEASPIPYGLGKKLKYAYIFNEKGGIVGHDFISQTHADVIGTSETWVPDGLDLGASTYLRTAKAMTISGQSAIAFRYRTTGTAANYCHMFTAYTAGSTLNLQAANGLTNISCAFGGSSSTHYSTPYSIFDGNEHDIVFQIDVANSQIILWVDGSPDVFSLSTPAATITDTIEIGAYHTEAYQDIEGTLEYFYVFDNVNFTRADVNALRVNPFEVFAWPKSIPVAAIAGITATLTGTATSSITESDVVTGGKTIILTLTGDTWVTAGATFDAQRQNIIDGIDSAQAEAAGWDATWKANEGVTAVVRTSDTVCTITMTAEAGYDITVQETITATIPATALTTSASAVVASPTFTVDLVSGVTIPIIAYHHRNNIGSGL